MPRNGITGPPFETYPSHYQVRPSAPRRRGLFRALARFGLAFCFLVMLGCIAGSTESLRQRCLCLLAARAW